MILKSGPKILPCLILILIFQFVKRGWICKSQNLLFVNLYLTLAFNLRSSPLNLIFVS